MKEKRFTLIILIIALLLTTIVFTACTESTNPDGNDDSNNTSLQLPESSAWLEFTLNEDGESYKVTNTNDPSQPSIVVGKHNDKPVTAIGSNAFNRCVKLNSITLSDCVQTIESNAFSGCTELTTLIFTKELKKIDADAFKGCKKLSEISKLNHVEELGDYAFANCENIKKAYLTNIKTIGDYAFSQCLSLSSIEIGSDIKYIGTFAFKDCKNIDFLSISSDTLKNSGGWIFYNCSIKKACVSSSWLEHIPKEDLVELELTSGTVSLPNDSYARYTNLEKLVIPASVHSIFPKPLGYSPKLKTVIFSDPENWMIGEQAIPSSDLSNPEKAAQYLIDAKYMIKVRG